MPDDSTPPPPLNLDDDPEIESMMREFEQQVEQQQAELETESQRLDAEIKAAETERKSVKAPEASAAQLAEWDQMERTYGVAPQPLGVGETTEHGEGALHGAELSHELLHTAENVIEQIAEHRHHAAAAREVQWYYAKGSDRVGPVKQPELLKLLGGGELTWDTLVWNKNFEDWTKASDTELRQLAQEPAPPPLPPPLPTAKKPSGKEQKCKSCGKINQPNDKFCAGCGKPLKKPAK